MGTWIMERTDEQLQVPKGIVVQFHNNGDPLLLSLS